LSKSNSDIYLSWSIYLRFIVEAIWLKPDGNENIAIVHTDKTKAHVIIYSRPNCHLCEEVKQAIEGAQCINEYTLEEINIESDVALLRRYRYEIPVVTINGEEAFKHKLTADEFRQRLAEAQ
jgi:glutaredoxin